ncbi:hypothetical protein [Halochromatium roseum]|uniref:hypothetical protein n=1 Tax=Halochromatium roseum TaxID=391920 RepID=UPI0019113E07|nr:hypothetical protein [Halochromatium roseum]MBK5939882.1 hypothetical protein [Halochromatium roseum]
MSKILDEMTHLRSDIDRAREGRAQAQQARSEQLADQASLVEGLLTGFAAARADQGAADRAARQQFLAGLGQDINALSQGVRDMMQDLQQARTEQAAAAAEERRAQVEAIADDIRGTLGEFKQSMIAFRSDYLASVDEDASARAGFVAETARQVGDLLNGFKQERSQQAAAAAQTRLAFMRDLSSQVAAIQNSVAEDLAGVRQLFGAASESAARSAKPVSNSARAKKPATAPASPAPSAAPTKQAGTHEQAQPVADESVTNGGKAPAAAHKPRKSSAHQEAKAKASKESIAGD